MNMTRAAEASIQAVSPVSILGTNASFLGQPGAAVPDVCRGRRLRARFTPVSWALTLRPQGSVPCRSSAVPRDERVEAVVVPVVPRGPGGVSSWDRRQTHGSVVRHPDVGEMDH